MSTQTYDAENRLIAATVQGAEPGPVGVRFTIRRRPASTSWTAGGVTTTYLHDKSVEHARVLVEQEPGVVATYTRATSSSRRLAPAAGRASTLVDGQLTGAGS